MRSLSSEGPIRAAQAAPSRRIEQLVLSRRSADARFGAANPDQADRHWATMAAMRLSRRSEYGIRALVDFVRHAPDSPVALTTLAARNSLPPKFLEQIMSALKRAGIVRTTLGAHGGYALAADPAGVDIGRIIRLLDGALAPLPCVSLRYYGRYGRRGVLPC